MGNQGNRIYFFQEKYDKFLNNKIYIFRIYLDI